MKYEDGSGKLEGQELDEFRTTFAALQQELKSFFARSPARTRKHSTVTDKHNKQMHKHTNTHTVHAYVHT